MAGTIRGITIELNGDTSGLTKSLQSANKEIKSTKGQLQDVERLLKLDPNNVELLRQKSVLLGQAIEETGSKLDDLKKAEEAMKNQGVDENSAQFMALKREIIATETEMNALIAEAGKTKSAFDQVATAANKVGTAAEKVAKKTAKLSAAGAAVAGGLLAVGANSIKSADELATMSKRTGISTNTLQKFAYAADMVDVSTEDMAGAFSKMKRQMGENPEAFTSLGVAVTDSEGNFRDLEAVFYDTLAALSQIPGETERDLAAMDVFGKGADTLATIIDDGGASLQELGTQAETMGLILSEDTIGKLTETGDTIDTLKATATATMAELGAKLIEELAPTLESIIEKVSEVINWISTLDGDTLNTIVTIGLVIAAISPLATAISGITTLIGGVTAALQFLMANPIVLLIAAIVGLVALIATKGDEIQGVLQGVDSFMQNIFAKDWTEQFGAIGEVVNLFMGIFEGIWNGVMELLNGVIDFIRGVFTGDWDRAWQGIQEIIDSVFTVAEGIMNAFDEFLSGIFEKDWSESLGAMGDVLNGLFASISEIWEGVKKVFQGVISFVRAVFQGDWASAWEAVKNIFKGVFDALVGIAKAPLNLIIGVINGLIDGLNWLIDGFNKISFDVPDWVPIIGGKTFGFNLPHITKIAYLAKGGILSEGSAVVGENGPEILTMTGRGAMVQPLTNNTTNRNYGGVTLNIYGAAGQSVEELADIIMDEIANATARQEAAFA